MEGELKLTEDHALTTAGGNKERHLWEGPIR